jgi:hypothetical protein
MLSSCRKSARQKHCCVGLGSEPPCMLITKYAHSVSNSSTHSKPSCIQLDSNPVSPLRRLSCTDKRCDYRLHVVSQMLPLDHLRRSFCAVAGHAVRGLRLEQQVRRGYPIQCTDLGGPSVPLCDGNKKRDELEDRPHGIE